jgi:hypothetical protein
VNQSCPLASIGIASASGCALRWTASMTLWPYRSSTRTPMRP